MGAMTTAAHDTPQATAAGPVVWKRVAAALPDLALAGAFLLTWLRPFALGSPPVDSYRILVILEFLAIHSAYLTGVRIYRDRSRRARLERLGFFAVLYTIFAAGVAAKFGVWWPLLAFWGLMLNRMLGEILEEAPRGTERLYRKLAWELSLAFFVGGIFAVTLLPIPELGWTADVRTGLGASGDEPHRILAFGVLYFGLTAVSGIGGWAWSRALRLGGRPEIPATPSP